jgi:peptidyl-prolyl cis-trans isomerase B (cyclophilin B)
MIAHLLVAVVCGSMWAAPPSTTTQAAYKTYAILETNFGTMVAELYPDEAPITVEHFIKLATEGFYINLPSHRMIPGFMVQLGKHTNPQVAAAVQPIKGEFSHTLKHYEGVLSMARSRDPDSATSQFFICFANRQHPSHVNLDGQYAIFGRLIEGYDVLRRIEMVRVAPNAEMGGELSRPEETISLFNVVIRRATVPPRTTAPQNTAKLMDIGETIVRAVRDSDTEMMLVDTWHQYLLSAKDMIGLFRFQEGLDYHEKYLASIPPPSVLVSALTMNMTASAPVQVKRVGTEDGDVAPTAGELMLIDKAGNIPLPIYRLILPSEGDYQQLSFIWIGEAWRWLGPLEQWLPASPADLADYEAVARGEEPAAAAAPVEPLPVRPAEQRPVLAVFDLETTERIPEYLGPKFAEYCRLAIDKTEQYRELSHDDMIAVLGEEEMAAATKCPDVACRLEYAKKVGADKIVYGRITSVGVTYIINVVLMDAESSRVEGTAIIKATEAPENLVDFVPKKMEDMVRQAVTGTR